MTCKTERKHFITVTQSFEFANTNNNQISLQILLFLFSVHQSSQTFIVTSKISHISISSSTCVFFSHIKYQHSFSSEIFFPCFKQKLK